MANVLRQKSQWLSLHLNDYIPPVGYAYWMRKIRYLSLPGHNNATTTSPHGLPPISRRSVFQALDRGTTDVGHVGRERLGASSVLLYNLWIHPHYRGYCGVEEALIRDALAKDDNDDDENAPWPEAVDENLRTVKFDRNSLDENEEDDEDDNDIPVVLEVLHRLGFVRQQTIFAENSFVVFKRQSFKMAPAGIKESAKPNNNKLIGLVVEAA